MTILRNEQKNERDGKDSFYSHSGKIFDAEDIRIAESIRRLEEKIKNSKIMPENHIG